MDDAESSAEFTLANDRSVVHPDYNTDDQKRVPGNWIRSDKIRYLIDQKGKPRKPDREDLERALVRQLKTIPLYDLILQKLKSETNNSQIFFYVILFPGSARDNTGIKDLNDNILGYSLTTEFIDHRQSQIRDIFQTVFDVVGQDYKTSTFLATNVTRKDFDKRLVLLDETLKRKLLDDLLPRAKKEARRDKDRLQNINKQQKALTKRNYKFDIFYGVAISLLPSEKNKNINKSTVVTACYLFLTEAVKAAAICRFIEKGRSVKTKQAKEFAKKISADKKHDSRGKDYQHKAFYMAFTRAGDIKAVMARKYTRKNPRDYYHILIDSVWTVAFLKHRRFFFGNPDVIRDVRKKKLKKPKIRDGNFKVTFRAQKEMLEYWLVILNMVDFNNQFTVSEFPSTLADYHYKIHKAWLEIQNSSISLPDWKRLEKVLTHDVRNEKVSVQGTASEYLFYSYAADSSEKIIFSMDIRDLGVELALFYEHANEDIEDNKYPRYKLMEETFRASEPIIDRKRFTYSAVERVFNETHALLAMSHQIGKSNGMREARIRFGPKLQTQGKIPAFNDSVQIMMGGDEIFIAAHPYFALYESWIIKRLAETIYFKDYKLNMRATVAYSHAQHDINNQRAKNQISHYEALTLADYANGTLKQFERSQRRIERLIALLDANENKRTNVGKVQKDLEKIGLLKAYCRVHRLSTLSRNKYEKMIRIFSMEDVVKASKENDFDVINFDGKVINAAKMNAQAIRLERYVQKLVGRDNKHIDQPPVTKEPKIIKKIFKLIEKFWSVKV